MKSLLFSITLLLPFFVNAQYNPKDYFAFDGKKQVIFIDEFNHPDTVVWGSENDTTKTGCVQYRGEYRNDKWILNNECNEELSISGDVNVDYTRNFEIVIVARVVYCDTCKGMKEAHVGWDINDSKQYYKLYFSGYKFQYVHEHLGLDTLKDQCIGTNKLVSTGVWDRDKFARYTIRKYNNTYHIFVDGLYAGKKKAINMNGKDIEVGVSEHAMVEIDHLSVWYLP